MAALARIVDVQFGPTGWLRLVGKDTDDRDITVDIALPAVRDITPRLVHGAALALEAEAAPGASIPPWIVQALEPSAFEAQDHREPCLSFHTHAGTFHIQFSPADAVACGKALQTIGAAASPPPSSNLNEEATRLALSGKPET